MPITLGLNLQASRTAYRLGRPTAGVTRTLERLSTGQRVNRAADDAAGLAVASTLAGREKILRRGAANVADGVSALSIASGALTQIGSVIQRQVELAEQAANGAFGSTQRQALNREY